MSYTITCPVCGKRDLSEFRFGNEDHGPLADPDRMSAEEYVNGALMRQTAAGPQKEWWCHSAGCGSWFTTWRNTLTGRETDAAGRAR